MRMIRVLGVSLGVAGAALAAACAPSIRSERDANIPVPQGATWAWAGSGSAPSRDTSARNRYIPGRYTYAVMDPIVRQRFVRATDAAMLARGFHRLEDTSQADFLLSLSFEPEQAYASRYAAAPAFGAAWYGGWGWGYSRWGFYRPLGFYRPWGWGWGWPWGWGLGIAAYPAYGYDAAPAYGASAYGDVWLVVQLRLRSDGEVAWIGRYRSGAQDLRSLSERQLHQVVDKLFATLR
jgi:uncharacterized protein DUF4136